MPETLDAEDVELIEWFSTLQPNSPIPSEWLLPAHEMFGRLVHLAKLGVIGFPTLEDDMAAIVTRASEASRDWLLEHPTAYRTLNA